MAEVNVREARTHLSRLLLRVSYPQFEAYEVSLLWA